MNEASNYIFTSERLGFRNWTESDLDLMQEVSSDPEVMEFFPKTATREQTKEFIDRMKSMCDEKGYSYFAVEEIETGDFIGFIGICDQDYNVPFCPMTDIGWRLNKSYWGKGYATEGAKRCLEYAFELCNLKEIYSTAPRLNERSWNVMEKIGMTLHLEFNHPNLDDDHPLADFLCYRITNE